MKCTLEHIAVGGNRHSSAADWGPSLLAFGAGNNIALWNPENGQQKGISALISGHTDAVNAVKIYDHEEKRLIISGAADKTIRIWRASETSSSGFIEAQCLTDHENSINALAILPEAGLFFSASADSTVKVWQLQDGTAKLIQSISLKPRYLPLALAVTSLSNGDTVLAVAGSSNFIQLYVKPANEPSFELQASLSGHEGWIRSLDFTRESQTAQSDILLASASQDKYIRLWRFRKGEQPIQANPHLAVDPSAVVAKKSLSNKAHQVGSPESIYKVTFEALLIGHDDWIYTARWQPRTASDTTPCLLSASADNSLAIWHADAGSGLWVCDSRLGEISSQKGSTTATGSTGGFWIGLWQPQARSVVSLSRTGSWRQWSFDAASDMWLQQVGISGHVQEVLGLAWSPSGDYLLSTSSDQTTRLLAEWHHKDVSSWHEISRPQIHGYDLNCIDIITENSFISGADEKLLRVFNKPKAVGSLLSKLSGSADSGSDQLPEVANIPVLGLSNKAVADAEDEEHVNGLTNGHTDDQYVAKDTSSSHKFALDLDHPPFEDHLARHTLWPEHEKLYGHGYEISAVATTDDGSLVATACKASSLDHAVIRLYETREWREVKPPLTAHTLTVTNLSFSPGGQYLLSVGRDRQWAVFERSESDQKTYTPHKLNPKGHSRMILDCSWAPLFAGSVFATAGRDKFVKVWRLNNADAECVSTISAGQSVTAVEFRTDSSEGTLSLAYGTEDGKITIVSLDQKTLASVDEQQLDDRITPSKSISALRWRPSTHSTTRNVQLACASDDYTTRIFSFS